ncbi:AAA family ATPase [Massilia sp. W12]|uniref:AAA family ATPase n=1 Tax=Massilia sp. W12 TaxID=3126507 RepID=UPI0030D4359A
MKILTVSGKNLASLAQEFCIDFTQGPLAACGLFAICGPTGAGKSTLLDALCLALFDNTPRLAKANRTALPDVGESSLTQQDTRNLLRRGASEGYAQVEFIGSDGRAWRARWAVRRARNQARGALQKVEMTLQEFSPSADAGGQLFAGKLSEVKAEIVQRLGLNFEQFTRAVLLAQNEFAAFLKADDAERGELLEILAGNPLYSTLSKRAWERHKQEQEQLHILRSGLQGQLPASAAERQAWDNAQQAALAQAQALSVLERNVQTEWRALQDWRELEQACHSAQHELQAAQAAQDAAQTVRQEWELTQSMQSARPLLQQVQACEQELHTLRQQAQQQALHSQKAQAAQEQMQQTLAQAQNALKQAEAETQAAAPALEQARALQSRLDALQDNLAQEEQAQHSRQQALQVLQQQAQALEQEAAQQNTQAKALQDWLQAHAALEQLAHSWEQQQSLVRRFEEEQAQQADFVRKQQDCAQALAEAGASIQTLQQACNDAEARHSASKQQRDQSQARLKPQAWQALQAQIHNWRQELTQIQEIEQSWSAQRQAGLQEEEAQQRVQSLLQECRQLEQEGVALQQQEHEQQLRWRQAQEMYELAQHSISAATLRAELREGEPCPVCGGKQHPYRKKAPPPSPAEAGLTALREATEQYRQAWQNSHDQVVQQTAVRQEKQLQLQDLQEQAQELARAAQETRAAWDLLLRDCALAQQALDACEHAADPQALPHWLQQRAEHSKRALHEAQQQEQAWQEEQEQLQGHNQALEQASLLLQAQRSALQQAMRRQEAAQQEAAHVLQQAQAAANAWQASRAALAPLTQALRPSLPALCTEDGGLHLARCADLVQAWRQRQEQARTLQQAQERTLEQSHALALRLAEQTQSAQQASQQWRASQQAAQELQQALQTLSPQRPWQDWQTALQHSLEASKQQTAQAQEEAQQAALLAAQALATAAQIDKQLQVSAEAHQEAQEALSEWLARWREEKEDVLDLRQLQRQLAHDAQWLQQRADELRALDEREKDAATVLRERRTQRDKQWLSASSRINDLSALPAEASTEEGQGLLPVVTEAPAWRTPPSWPPADAAIDAGALLAAAGERCQHLQQAYSSLQRQQRAQQQLAARMQAKLEADNEKQAAAAELQQQIGARQQTAQKWAALADLIGSSDGKKFRNYAQQFTLDVLLQHANLHLQQLGRRYRLERIPGSLTPLVLDLEMGEEKRSLHSLSGGESFLVSLALALALASLSANRVNVESLFIDEGFGSLDGKTLQMAMAALDNLQALGRKVGVISHVQEMTEQIATKIVVQKGAGGRSSVQVVCA